MYTTWWANSCTIIVCCEGMHHMLTDAFWILPLLLRKSLFLSLEVPTSFKNSGYWQETNLITTATTIKNSDLQKQEFQQLAKTKEMGTQLCMHFGLCIHPWRSAACTLCILHNLLFPSFYRVASGVSNIIDHPLTKQPFIDRFLIFQLFLSLL